MDVLPPSPKSARMKNQNSIENPKTPIHPPSFGVRALCAAFLLAPVCLGAYLWVLSRPVNTLFTFVNTGSQ
jgi:hypothetical protein